MKSHFEKHGLMYLSASTINLWISQPSLCLLKIAGFQDDEIGPSVWRGVAVDNALSKALEIQNITEQKVIKSAEIIYDENFAKAKEKHEKHKVLKEKENIPKFIKTGLEFYQSIKEKPLENQGKVYLNLDDIDIPFIGFFDLLYRKQVRDIKTVGKTVKKLSEAHCRQVSIYAKATNKEPWIDYISTKSVNSFRVKNINYWISQIIIASKSLERVLSYSDDIKECCQLVYPDFDNWMWSEKLKKIAKDIWKLDNELDQL